MSNTLPTLHGVAADYAVHGVELADGSIRLHLGGSRDHFWHGTVAQLEEVGGPLNAAKLFVARARRLSYEAVRGAAWAEDLAKGGRRGEVVRFTDATARVVLCDRKGEWTTRIEFVRPCPTPNGLALRFAEVA